MAPELLLALLAIALALFFDFTNGFHDSANQVATVIKTNAMRPRVALSIAAIFDFIGAYFLGTAVAQTIGKGIVDPALIQSGMSGVMVIVSALIGATTWNLWTWYKGWPSSSSHSLIGGITGAFIAGWGLAPVNWAKVSAIIFVLIISPIIGFLMSFLLTKIVFFFSKKFTLPNKLNLLFNKAQYVTLSLQSVAHGSNDAQKTMGVIAFILVISGLESGIQSNGSITIPTWVILSCSTTIALGVFTGGWRIIKTLGWGIYNLRPIHSFVSQFSSAGIIYSASLLGLPISTTQTISSSIIGSCTAENPELVHWNVAKSMAQAWMITIPASATISAICLFTHKENWLYVAGLSLMMILGYVFSIKVNVWKIFNGNSEKDFQKMLIAQIDSVLEGVKLVERYCFLPSIGKAQLVDIAEKEADAIHSGLIKKLRDTFVTGPFDRHNIEKLSQELDDIIDEAKKAVIRMSRFEVKSNDYIADMASKLVRATELIREALTTLSGKSKNPKRCQECINSARKLENAIQHVFENWYIASNPKVDDLNGKNTVAKTTEILKQIIDVRNEEKVHIAFMKAAEQIVDAANEIEIILAKTS